MKKFTLILTLILIFGMTQNNANEAEKPQYEINVKVEGESIGKIVLELYPDVAPKTVANFDSLVKEGFYDGTAFHRVIPGFMIQGGDPNSKDKPRNTWGVGAEGQKTVPAEFSDISHKEGIVSMARKGGDVNSATSQFFICVADSPFLDGKYTAFGEVVEGMDVAHKIVNMERDSRDNPLKKVEMYVKPLDKK